MEGAVMERMWVLGTVASLLVACAADPGGGVCATVADCARGDRCVAGRCMPTGSDGGGSDSGPRPDSGPLPPPVDAGDFDGAFPCGELTFPLTATEESFRVPANVRYMHVKAWGAGGNDERACGTTPDGGTGGFTEAVFAVGSGTSIPADTELVVIVGQRGRAGTTGEDLFRFGFGAWGGGGLTGVFRGPSPIAETDQDRALVVAGGGGSASGPDCSAGIPGNYPGAGGAGSMLGDLPSGSSPLGGAGGYEGGTVGARNVPSNGGTGFVSAEATDSLMLHSEPGTNAPPRTDDPDYDGMAGTSELSGLMVIRYLCEAPSPLI